MRVTKRISVAIVVAFTLNSALPVLGAEPPIPVGVDATQLADLQNTGAPLAVEGQLLDRAGRPTSGTVQALAWPTEAVLSAVGVGQPVERIPVAAAHVGPDGQFGLRLTRGALPAGYISADGQVDLELIAWNDENQSRWFTSVRADIAEKAPVWVQPIAAKNLSAARAVESGVRASITLTERLAGLPQATGDVAMALPTCPPATLVSTHNVWVLIGRSMNNETGQTSWMHDGSSHTVTLGVAVSADSTFGYSASGTSSTTTGVTFTWAGSSSDRRYYVQTQYGKWRFTCAGQTQYTFRPRVPTGGFTQTVSSLNPAWSNCATLAAGTWTRSRSDGNTTSFSAGVEAAPYIGINLSFQSNYASTRTLNYKLTTSGRVCGSNNLPSLASEVEAET